MGGRYGFLQRNIQLGLPHRTRRKDISRSGWGHGKPATNPTIKEIMAGHRPPPYHTIHAGSGNTSRPARSPRVGWTHAQGFPREAVYVHA